MNVLSASVVKARLHQGDEIALLDVREAGESGEGRPLLAINLPYSVLEARAITLLPSTTTPIVVMDDGNDDDRAARAAARLAAQGYADVSIMDGGLAAWARLFGEFCASSAVAVGVQLGVAAALRFRAPGGAAQLCGILCGTAINFAAQNWVVFRARGARSDEKLSTDLRSV